MNEVAGHHETLDPRLAELLRDPTVAQCLWGRFKDVPEIGNHRIGKASVVNYTADNVPAITDQIIDSETVYSLLVKQGRLNLRHGDNDFAACVAEWGDGGRAVFTLTFTDPKADPRPGGHTDFHLILPPEKTDEIELLRQDPSALIDLFHQAYPAADRSEGRLALQEFVPLGIIAPPR